MEPRIARRALAGAFIAGLVADAMFDRIDLGSNVPLGTIAVLALVTWFGRERRPVDRLDLWLPAVALLASLGPVLRTDPAIVALDLFLVAGGVAGWSFAVSGVALTRKSARAAVVLGMTVWIAIATALPWLFGKAMSDGATSRGVRQLGRLAPIVRGGVIAAPVVFGFALLLGSADAVFGRALDDALDLGFDLDEVLQRGWFTVIAAAFVAGPLVIAAGAAGPDGAWLYATPPPPAPGPAGAGASPATGAAAPAIPDATRTIPDATPSSPGTPPAVARRSGVTETLVVLVAVDLLFAAFATVQVLFLFGGADTLAAVGMTYSDYARQGYFQLVGVVGLAGLLLLGAHEVIGRTRPFLVAGLVLLVLTGVILASAAFRLGLYQGAYGWTELRFYVAASITWLAAGVALAIALLAADRMRWLAHGLVGSAIAITLAVSAIGPQAFVVGQNLARVRDPGLVPADGWSGFDGYYAITLGDDAVPDLVAALAEPNLDPATRQVVLDDLRWRKAIVEAQPPSGPLSWNLARQRAREALARLPAE